MTYSLDLIFSEPLKGDLLGPNAQIYIKRHTKR